jgi:predicted lipoprotein
MAMRIAALTLALLLPASTVQAAPDYKAIELAALDGQIVPGFRQFAERAAALQQTAETFCKKPDAQGLEAVRGGFNNAMDAWQAVQYVSFGPVEMLNRGQRIQFWPDKRNAGDRQLLALLRDRKAESLDPSRLPNISVGVQGLPALETLLYGKDQPEKLLVADEDAAFRCRLITVIAGNLATIGNDIAAEFSKPDGFRAAIENVGTATSRYANHREAALQLFNAVHGELEAVAEAKLSYPLGIKPAEARAGRAESWRSKRSLRNVIINLEAVKAVFAAAFAPALAKQSPVLITQRFDATLAQAISFAQKLPPMEDNMTTTDGWRNLSASKIYVKGTAAVFEQVGAELDLAVGFNALDGD